jgi:hypothetical protein
VGIFGRMIEAAYPSPLPTPSVAPISVSSPWTPQDSLVTFALDQELPGLRSASDLTRDMCLRVPGIARAHGIHCTEFAAIEFYEMDGNERVTEQPKWLTSGASGVSPYHRRFGVASDLFFWGWACVGFTADLSDCLHIPFGLWRVNDDGTIWIDPDKISGKWDAYRARPVMIPLGYGQNGLMVDGVDTINEARQIEAAYMDRLANPVPLTVLDVPWDVWNGWTPEERSSFRNQWIEGRRASNGSTAMKPDTFGVSMPGAVEVNLYETGRNAVRLDIANHTSTPASLLEGVRQGGGGGGTEIRYSGVQNGAAANELWRFGLARRMTLAFEGRLSLDDVCPPGHSIRGDLSSVFAIPDAPTNPTSED